MKLSKGGLKFCAVYVCYFVVLSGFALIAKDPKGAWLLGQLSVAPGLMFFFWSGLADLLQPYARDTWINSGLFTFPLSLAVVYLIGWPVSAFFGGIEKGQARFIHAGRRSSELASAVAPGPLPTCQAEPADFPSS